jgi:hypothetical protein
MSMGRWALFFVGLSCSLGVWAQSQPLAAQYRQATERYPHNIMGALSAHTTLAVQWAACPSCPPEPESLSAVLPEALVFEDFAPRLVDINGDGTPEVLVVESHQKQGARLALWEIQQGRLVRGASTDFIGTRFRWLAPIGVADFLGQGIALAAYVEKPHLDKVLRLVRRDGDRLVPVASVPNVTNHLIGQESVQSRVESCPEGPRIVLLSANAQRVLVVGWGAQGRSVRDVGPARDRQLPADVSACGA